MIGSLPAPGSHPLLGFLVAGFVLMVVGLAVLSARRRPPEPMASAAGTRRALLYALFYALCASCFARLVSPALLGHEQSPWLLALGDVMFVTLGLYVWVMVLVEDRPLREYGLHWGPTARLRLTLALGLGAAALYSLRSYQALAAGDVRPTADSLVFALVFAAAGSALPEELLFRGYLQGSLAGRVSRWAAVAIPALAFTLVRSFRYAPGLDLPIPEWILYVVGTALPLGLWWGLMRDLAGGSLWPGLISHFVLEFGTALASASPSAARS